VKYFPLSCCALAPLAPEAPLANQSCRISIKRIPTCTTLTYLLACQKRESLIEDLIVVNISSFIATYGIIHSSICPPVPIRCGHPSLSSCKKQKEKRPRSMTDNAPSSPMDRNPKRNPKMNMKFARLLRPVETITPGGCRFPSSLHSEAGNSHNLLLIHHSSLSIIPMHCTSKAMILSNSSLSRPAPFANRHKLLT